MSLGERRRSFLGNFVDCRRKVDFRVSSSNGVGVKIVMIPVIRQSSVEEVIAFTLH